MADKITKLSDAIRLGATFRPQCRGGFFQQGMSCALGAAYEAVTGEYDSELEHGVVAPLLRNRFGVDYDMLCAVVHRNDDGKETREAIADWLENEGY